MFKNTQFAVNARLDFWIKTAVCTLLLCLLAPIKIDVSTEIPITLQTLMVLLGAIAFGRNIGALSTLLYLAAGAFGAPVFAGHTSGFAIMAGPTGGYLFGFVAAALTMGHLAEKTEPKQAFRHFALWIGGHAVILLCGLPWQLTLSGDSLSESKNLLILLGRGAMIKSAAGMLLLMLFHRFITPRETFYSKTKS